MDQDPLEPPPPANPGRARVLRRLFIGAVAVGVVSVIAAIVLPRLGISFPIWVPFAMFIPIALGALFSADFRGPEDGDAGNPPTLRL